MGPLHRLRKREVSRAESGMGVVCSLAAGETGGLRAAKRTGREALTSSAQEGGSVIRGRRLLRTPQGFRERL